MEIKAVAIGEITGRIAKLELGSEGIYAGFLGATRNGRGLVFHVTALD
jgi:primosomal replication protein N